MNTSKSAKSLMSQETSGKNSFILHLPEVIRNIPTSYRGLVSRTKQDRQKKTKTANNIHAIIISRR